MPKPPGTWKHVELWYARDLGCERNSKHGQGEGVPDVCPGYADIEVKHGGQVPKSVERFMQQAETNCRSGQVPVVIMHALGQPFVEGLVVMRYADWKRCCDVWQDKKVGIINDAGDESTPVG